MHFLFLWPRLHSRWKCEHGATIKPPPHPPYRSLETPGVSDGVKLKILLIKTGFGVFQTILQSSPKRNTEAKPCRDWKRRTCCTVYGIKTGASGGSMSWCTSELFLLSSAHAATSLDVWKGNPVRASYSRGVWSDEVVNKCLSYWISERDEQSDDVFKIKEEYFSPKWHRDCKPVAQTTL